VRRGTLRSTSSPVSGSKKAQAVDAVIEQFHPYRFALGLRRKDVDDIAAHPIGALLQIDFVARVLHVGQTPQQLALLEHIAARHVQHHAQVRLRDRPSRRSPRPSRR
jgi:hypothetical protein